MQGLQLTMLIKGKVSHVLDKASSIEEFFT